MSVGGAIPLVDDSRLRGPDGAGTSALAFLLFSPGVSTTDRTAAAESLAAHRFQDRPHVTGVVPARIEAADIISGHLWLVELVTGALVALIVGIHFRAIGAPLATLAVVVVSYLLAARAIPWLADRAGVAVPSEVAPMIVVLLFGALTDYTVFFLSRFRARLAAGEPRLAAARAATRQLAGIVTIAASIVAGASSALLLARFGFFRAFGPGMAAAIAVGWCVVVTLMPALLAIFGSALFWPSPTAPRERNLTRRRRVAAIVVRHPLPAALLLLVLVGGGDFGVLQLRLADPVLEGLPADSDARLGYQAIGAGFGPGVASPTVVIVRGKHLDRKRAALARLEHSLAARTDVARVLGPTDNPLPQIADDLGLPGRAQGVFLTRDGSTARFALAWRGDPLGADAIARVQRLRQTLPGMLRASGLDNARAMIGGDTALAGETISIALNDLAIVGPAVVLVVLLILAIYLRAIVVPLLLVLASAAALTAALGITGWVWSWLGGGGLAYYVPFAVAVLLLGLGSDYGVLLVGRVWQASRDRPLAEAITEASARAARPINVAGTVLALSFALLAIVPLEEFRQFGLAMCIGLLLDAFLVRPLLVPALIMLAARAGAAPASRAAGSDRRRAAGARIARDAESPQPTSSAQRPAANKPRGRVD